MNDREDRRRCCGRLSGRVGLEDPHILEMAKKERNATKRRFTGGPMKSTSDRARKKNFARQKKKIFPFTLKAKRSVSPG